MRDPVLGDGLDQTVDSERLSSSTAAGIAREPALADLDLADALVQFADRRRNSPTSTRRRARAARGRRVEVEDASRWHPSES